MNTCPDCRRPLWTMTDGLVDFLRSCPGTGSLNCIEVSREIDGYCTDSIRKGVALGIVTMEETPKLSLSALKKLTPEEACALAGDIARRAEQARAAVVEVDARLDACEGGKELRGLLQRLCGAYECLVTDPDLPVEERQEIKHHLDGLVGDCREALK